ADFQSPQRADISSPSPAPSVDPAIEHSILGKRPDPPSPASIRSLPRPSTAMEVDSAPSSLVPTVDWDKYFNNLENAISGLQATPSQTPRYLGVLLTALQSLLRDSSFLNLKTDGRFSVANLLDALPRSKGEATTPPTRGPDPARSRPPPPKKVKFNPPAPAPPKASAPAKPVAAPPPALNQRPPPSEAPAVSQSAPTAPAKRPAKRQGKHTVHGTTRRGIIISPPADIDFRAEVFTSESFNALNHCLKNNLK